ncbi:MAG: DMT family transporter [Pseudomonadota bacterium]
MPDVDEASLLKRWRFRVFALVALAIAAFAGNSLLTRAALADGAMDATSFAAMRLASGAAALCIFALWRGQSVRPGKADIGGVIALFVYMAGFSLAYSELDAATGALLLFGLVQMTVLAVGVMRGDRPRLFEISGMIIAFGGLVLLVGDRANPASAPPVLMMAAAGVGWGVYTLLGRGAGDPLGRTARNFIGATPLAAFVALLLGDFHLTSSAFWLAVASGVVTSAMGYAIWYAVLPSLSRISAGVSQLLVPPVTALGGAALLAEPLTLKLAASSVIILAGVALTMITPARTS